VSLNWDSVSAKHIERACEQLAAQGKDKRTGLVVVFRDHALPAKDVVRLAYRHANGLADSVQLKFSSGDGTLAMLRKLGFTAERRIPSDKLPPASAPQR
jgi:L-aminopeptidase/D-esterase-like protein